MSAPMTQEREQVRAELMAEFVAWLVKKAREHRAQGPQYAKQADVIGRLADKASRGAVRPNNLLSLPAQGGPEDVPTLLAEVDRLSAEVAGLRQGYAALEARCDYIAKAAVSWRKEADGRKAYGLRLRAELAPYRALELGAPEGRVSAKCEDASHPVWLREPDDMRGCPWCRIAELEAQAEKVAAFCDQRAEYVINLRAFVEGGEHDYYRWQGHAESRRQLSERLGLPVAWPAETEPRTAPSQREAGAL